jgi:hypothetical protein
MVRVVELTGQFPQSCSQLETVQPLVGHERPNELWQHQSQSNSTVDSLLFLRDIATLAEGSNLHDTESRFQAIVRVRQLEDVATQASARFLQPSSNRSTTLSQDTSSTQRQGFQPLERTSESRFQPFVVRCSSPKLSPSCSIGKNGFN